METLKSIGKWVGIIICVIVVLVATEQLFDYIDYRTKKVYICNDGSQFLIYIRLAAKCMVIGYLQLNSMRLGKMAIHYVKSVKKTTI